MIKVVLEEGRLVPAIICDICHSRITDAMKAAAVNGSMLNVDEEVPDRVLHVHKGKCHDTAEAQLGTPDSPAGWEELSTHLYFLCYNVGLTPDWFEKRDKTFEEFGM